ncbi:hypothetical protein Mnod_0244 [Methylobacterium nodulans ORS 2060]|uniref:Uncharacterized protein n=1 Tax=Methylobacterium nodulans (strain LMG 21967 / CNCM I-2342 / ORS 2060) TaxID=460265 RepID=B8I9N5_METNO|nr:hypothetical protein Mnod_0244 [Methylobacterium nodulans ORS 2060]
MGGLLPFVLLIGMSEERHLRTFGGALFSGHYLSQKRA